MSTSPLRLPGRPALAVFAVLALALAAGTGALVASTGRTGLSVAVAAIGVGLALNLLLSFLAVRQLARLGREHERASTGVAQLHARLDRQRNLIDRNHRTLVQVRKRQGEDLSRRRTENLNQLAQVQETVRLFTTIPTAARVPAMGGWAASADMVGALVDELVERRPGLIVECGSGVSTLWLSLVVRQHDLPTRIVALDHDPVFAAGTRATLERHGVSDIAEVRDAPLAPIEIDGREWTWYDRTASRDLEGIGLLFVDGPPQATGPHARFPALPVLRAQLADRCSIVLDDMIRTDEQEIADQWQQTLDGFERVDLPLEKGATVFRRG